jgi:excisionase family DNA binding protein
MRVLVFSATESDQCGIMKTKSEIDQLELEGVAAAVEARDGGAVVVEREEAARVVVDENNGGVHRKSVLRSKAEVASPAAKIGVECGGLESLLSFAQAARALGISLRQFRRLVDGGKVAFVKVSERSPRIRPSELQRFLEVSAVKYSEVES